LKAHGATDLRRYDVLKDIQRLERFNRAYGGPSYVDALTNDPAYWKPIGPERLTIDSDFRLCDGRTTTGRLTWAAHAGSGSTKGREKPIELTGQYTFVWQDYAQISESGATFRCLCIEVGGQPIA
jgi:hypothetical protein